MMSQTGSGRSEQREDRLLAFCKKVLVETGFPSDEVVITQIQWDKCDPRIRLEFTAKHKPGIDTIKFLMHFRNHARKEYPGVLLEIKPGVELSKIVELVRLHRLFIILSDKPKDVSP